VKLNLIYFLPKVSDVNRVAAVIQAVAKDNSIIYGKPILVKSFLNLLTPYFYDALAASDSRKNGIAAGY